MIYHLLSKYCLFRIDPERVHRTICQSLKIAQQVEFLKGVLSNRFSFSDPTTEFNLLGHHFSNPVGLAAGFDKNCEMVGILPCFGFGFIECGTITSMKQEGNPKPRIFRLPEEYALINKLGFNNWGATHLRDRLSNATFPPIPLGINIGRSARTPLEDSAEDYLYSFEKLYVFADYFTINVSSPNTAGLRDLQGNLSPLLSTLQKKNSELAKLNHQNPKPLFVKISPDLTFSDLDRISESCIDHGVTGLIATNTTTSHEGAKIPHSVERYLGSNPSISRGGLSGKPLEKRSTEILRYLYKHFGKKLIMIGVGGIFSAEDAYRKIKAGASLLQLYTGWVYGGPSTVSLINRGLVSLLRQDGLKNIQDAVGVEGSS